MRLVSLSMYDSQLQWHGMLQGSTSVRGWSADSR